MAKSLLDQRKKVLLFITLLDTVLSEKWFLSVADHKKIKIKKVIAL